MAATVHVLEATRATLHGRFSPELEPVLTVDGGDTVRFRTLDVGWGLEQHTGPTTPRRKFEPRLDGRDDGPALTGPVAVRRARAGTVLAVELLAVRPGPWGWTFGDRAVGLGEAVDVPADQVALLRWTLDREHMTATDEAGRTVAMDPFPGTIGLAPAEPGHHLAWPPRRTGGNIDCRELVAGSTLYLPVAVDGALVSVGDGHAAQGDGEVGGMAIECPLEAVDVRLTPRPDLAHRWPRADTPAGWVTFGFDEDLDRAIAVALGEMLDLLQERLGCVRAEALALASVAVDVRITQLVNGVRGAHALLPHGAVTAS